MKPLPASFMATAMAIGASHAEFDPKGVFMYRRGEEASEPLGCGSAGCRTLHSCLCSCRRCRAECNGRKIGVPSYEDGLQDVRDVGISLAQCTVTIEDETDDGISNGRYIGSEAARLKGTEKCE